MGKGGLSLQLSSPVEDAKLTNVGESTTFRGVEIEQATLSVNGQAAVQDVAVFTQNLLKPLEDTRSYTKEVSIALESSKATVFFKTTFVPSNDDLRKILYEQLNEATQRKASARNALGSRSGETKKKSVSFGGFLNNKEEAKPSKLLVWFQTAVAIAPRVKNYVFFAVFVFASNYRGHLLALPEPV